MFNYGERIKNIRNIKSTSAYRLAKDLDVAQQTISKIETGTNIPSLQLLERICEYFSITLSDFFYDDSYIKDPIFFEDNKYSELPLEDIIHLYIELYPENSALVINQSKALNNQADIIDIYKQELKKTQDQIKEQKKLLAKQKETYNTHTESFKNMLIAHISNKDDLD